ncbi:hypothetical protein EDB87DRAFT_1638669 [Lactarius vividus]|nr:hypothetical protein EDB87DRAFT_1638669 [Lactarius vividus]
MGPYPRTSARNQRSDQRRRKGRVCVCNDFRPLRTRAPVWLDGWVDGGKTHTMTSTHPSRRNQRSYQRIHHRESADTASATAPSGSTPCGDGGGSGTDGWCSGAWPLSATHFSAALAARPGVALSSSSDVRLSSTSASVAVASVCSESSNSSSSSSSSPSSSLDSTRSPSPPSICRGAIGDVGVGKPIAGGGGGGGGGGNIVTQDCCCEARYRSELGRGISPRNARRDLFSSFFANRSLVSFSVRLDEISLSKFSLYEPSGW